MRLSFDLDEQLARDMSDEQAEFLGLVIKDTARYALGLPRTDDEPPNGDQ